MNLEFKKKYLIGIFLAIVILIVDFYLYFFSERKRLFVPVLIVALTVGWIQFWIDFLKENKRQKEVEEKFLEFIRSLVGVVKSGVSIPRGILNVADEDYGALTVHVRKLANQIEWGIPIHKALVTFANDTENTVIKRSVAIMIEADESGGDIEDILESVSSSVVNVKKMKEQRRSSVYSQVLQGYIVFFVFIGIMLLLQLWLFPKLTGALDISSNSGEVDLSTVGGFGSFFGRSEEKINIDLIFFSLVLIQGFFTGIMIGKFSEGSIKKGLIHSVVMMTLAALIITTFKGGI